MKVLKVIAITLFIFELGRASTGPFKPRWIKEYSRQLEDYNTRLDNYRDGLISEAKKVKEASKEIMDIKKTLIYKYKLFINSVGEVSSSVNSNGTKWTPMDDKLFEAWSNLD